MPSNELLSYAVKVACWFFFGASGIRWAIFEYDSSRSIQTDEYDKKQNAKAASKVALKGGLVVAGIWLWIQITNNSPIAR